MIGQSTPPLQVNYHPPTPIAGIIFRLAQHQDLEMLWKSCYPDAIWSQFEDHFEYLLKWQASDRCYILVAVTTNNADIVGSGQLIRQSNKAEIAELAVREDYQCRGIGTAIIQILTQLAKERHLSLLEIGAAIENESALRLYKRLGFSHERQLILPNSKKAIVLSKDITTRGT